MSTKRFYPVYLDIALAPCLVVGGGPVAERKVESLLECGAKVKLISPTATEILQLQAVSGLIEWCKSVFQSGNTKGHVLVIAATSDRGVNAEIYSEARDAGIPVNTVDDPEYCTFIVPAVARKGDILMTAATGGSAPGVSGRIRDKIAACIGDEYVKLVSELKKNRNRIKTLPPQLKSDFWKQIIALDIDSYASRAHELPELVENWISIREQAGHEL